MTLCQALLELQKNAEIFGEHGSKPFYLSLRDPLEFSDVHTFGLQKVPHIGVYGKEYSVCSPLVLLSLPVTPRSLRALPYELISALDLKNAVTTDSTQSMSEVSEHPHQYHHFPHATSSHNASDSNIRAVAQKLVTAVLEAAVRRVCGGGREEEGSIFLNIAGGRESKLDVTCDMEIACNVTQPRGRMDIWNETCTTTGDGSECDNSKAPREEEFLFEREHQVYFARDDKSIALDMEAERKGLARRLVLKCIRAACNEISSQEHLGDSIESLISCTKRMRIDSPPLFSDTACISSSSDIKTTAMAEPRSPLLDRCLTPESMLRGKLWKKRARSESHEVNSLLEDCHRFQSTYVKRGDDTSLRSCNAGTSCGVDYVIDDSSASGVIISSIVAGLNKMMIDEVFSKREEKEEDECERRIDSPSVADGSRKGVKFNVSSLLTFHHCKAPLKSPHPPSPTISSDDRILDVRAAANADCIPEMDFYFIFHSCPPPSECQKFLCSNMDEINLLFHCWLFQDIPCDPSITVSDQLDMGVFAPQNVQPVHLDLADSGVPFYYMEPRTVCIHSCCFSPENAQLQLVPRSNCRAHSSITTDFHSFFSAGRHGNRRVVTFHFLPSSCVTEKAVKEAAQSCSSLDQLVDALGPCFPEFGQAISSIILCI